jgi:undecaprenyl-diphosphatase
LESGVDAWLVRSVNSYALDHSWFAATAVFSASALPDVLVALLILYVATRSDGSARLLLLVLVVMAAAWLVARGFQSFWLRPRPFEAGVAQSLLPHRGGGSFPSTHASVVFAVGWLGVVLRAPWRWVGLWWMMGLTVVTGRVVCALHYPSDVVGGLLVGGACAAVGFAATRRTGLFLHAGTRP